jgi:hypothetical protein
MLTLHEISLVLLFNDELFPFFIDENLKTLNTKDIIHEEKNKFNQKILYIKSPNVLRIAKKHFNCKNLKGVPLEYNGKPTAVEAHLSRKAIILII